MVDKESLLNAETDYLITKFNECLVELNRLTSPTYIEKLLQSLGSGQEFALLEISKRIRNLLRVGYKDGEKRAEQFTTEGRGFYTSLQNQQTSEHVGYSLKESRFANHVGWHRIKVKEYLDELKLIDEISKQSNKTNIVLKKDDQVRSQTISSDKKNKLKHDVFICHASEDKDSVARPFAEKLQELGLTVWYDEFNLGLGKSIRGTIDEGLKSSSYGVVILSKTFFTKEWTKRELDALVSIFNTSEDRILPIRYGLTPDEVSEISPILAGIFSRSWDDGLENLANEVYQIATGQSKQMIHTKSNVHPKNNFSEFEILLDKFTENGIHHVGIHNGGKAIRTCSIQCEGKSCIWWDDYQSDPRHIQAGGGGNVMIPLGFANINPTISVLSSGKIVEQFVLNEIPKRPGSKWNAKDNDDVNVERVRFSINRIRSELVNLQSLFQLFLDYKEGLPIDEQMRSYLVQKDDSVERLQNMTNQSAHLLEPDWTSDITDLCVRAKRNPWMLPGKLQVLQCMNCEGVTNQIKSLLDKLPNPPV